MLLAKLTGSSVEAREMTEATAALVAASALFELLLPNALVQV